MSELKEKRQTSPPLHLHQKKSQTSPPPHLHHELFFSHILPRLPAESLLRFSSVSKLWCTTIGDSKFVASHFLRSQSNPHLLGIFEGNNKSPQHLIFNLDNINFEGKGGTSMDLEKLRTATIACPYSYWVGSCNGLICFYSNFGCGITDPSTQKTSVIRYGPRICNPSTREVLVIPSPNQYPNEDLRSVAHYGFGFDPFNEEYKVVRMYNSNKLVMVYTLGTNSWRSIAVPSHISDHFNIVAGEPVFSDGALHWCTIRLGDVDDFKVFSFDIHSEELRMIPAPIYVRENRPMFELQGCLCFPSYNAGSVDLYKLNKDGGKHYWAKESILVTPGVDLFSNHIAGFVAFLNEVLYHSVHQELLTLYDLHTGTKKVVKLLFDFLVLGCEIINHVENLLSLETFVPPGESKVVYASYRESREEGKEDHQLWPQYIRRRCHFM